MHRKIMRIIRACKLSEHTLCYVFINGRELCPEQVCKLSGGGNQRGSNYPGYTVHASKKLHNLPDTFLFEKRKIPPT